MSEPTKPAGVFIQMGAAPILICGVLMVLGGLGLTWWPMIVGGLLVTAGGIKLLAAGRVRK